MDFSNLDGYMFEELIVSLLKEMGFSVEQTALSGDGGIDIIAYSKEPIFRGKYLIQCKNWRNQVGQPEVRDLFGVVMSEQANKGILITTSYFTEQAVQFADNKNIELIGYDVLVNLLDKYGINTILDERKSHKIIHFADVEGFDNERYKYLKSKVENNRTEKLYYDNLKEFYHQYIISPNYEINMNGLIDEYINLNCEIIKRFCKKSNEKVAEGNSCKYIIAYLYILKGEIFNALEIYNDLGLLTHNKYANFLPTTYRSCSYVYNHDIEKLKELENITIVWENGNDIVYKGNEGTSPFIIIKNLYLLFNKLDYSIGINYLDSLLIKNYDNVQKDKINPITFNVTHKYIIEESVEVFKQIKNSNYNRFHIPVKVSTSKNYFKVYETKAHFKEEIFMPIEDLTDIYYFNMEKKIADELNKTKMLLDIYRLENSK